MYLLQVFRTKEEWNILKKKLDINFCEINCQEENNAKNQYYFTLNLLEVLLLLLYIVCAFRNI